MGNGCSKCCQCDKHLKYHGTLSSTSSVYGPRKRGDVPIYNSDRFRITQTSKAVQLAIEQVQREDGGHYTLFAHPKCGDVLRKDIELIVDDRSTGDDPPIFLRRLGDLSVKVGTRTRLLVEIRSSTDVKVTWYRNDRRICENERIKEINEGSFFCLELQSVTLEDGGHWMVMAENLGGRSSSIAHLDVLVPKAYKPPEFIEELRAVLTEQGTVSLECKVVGVPTPLLRWFKDSKEIKAGDVFALTANVDDPTSLGTYTCEAVNCMGKSYSSSKVHVVGRGSRDGSLKPADSKPSSGLPPIFTNELRGVSVRIGATVTLGCQVVVPPWPGSVAWYNKDGRVESSERYKLIEDGLGVYMIEIKPSASCDEGEWKCVVTSQEGCVGISTCVVEMDIPKNYRKPRFMESLKAVLTEEGLVSFECKVVGFPTPVLKWFKDSQELKPGDVYQLTGTNSLGSYCCIARNCMGESSSTAVLTVEDIQNQLNEDERLLFAKKNQPPNFVVGLKSQVARINEPFKFSVTLKATPDPALSWFRDELPIESNERYKSYHSANEQWHLEILCVEFVDQAEWKCVAVNDFGTSITSCFLKLQIPRHYKKPRFLESLRAVLTEEGAVNLECKVIGVPQPILKWYKDGFELKPGDIHRIISGQDGTCCLGTYTCEARNCMGIIASSASLLGYEDAVKNQKQEELRESGLKRNLSLSTIQEERTSQLYETPVGDVTIDDKGDISFSFDGKEVSVSLYETPDLTEEEAIKVIEMYADQISEHVTEHNIVELPPLRFVKETSQSGKLLMEAVVIDISPDYFSHEDDMRTEAGMDDISISEITIHGSTDRDANRDANKENEFFSQKSVEKMAEELSAPSSSKKCKKTRISETDEFYSLSKASSREDEDTSEMQTFASAQMSSGADNAVDASKDVLKPMAAIPSGEEQIKNNSKNPTDSDSSKTTDDDAKLQDISGAVGDGLITSRPSKVISNEAEIEKNLKTLLPFAKYIKVIANHLNAVENEVVTQSEAMMTPSSAEQSIAILRNISDPIEQIQSKLRVYSGDTSLDNLFHSMNEDIRMFHTGLQVIEKCVEIDESGATLIQRTSVCIVDSVGDLVIKAFDEVKRIAAFFEMPTLQSHFDLIALDIQQGVEVTQGTIKSQALLQEAQDLEAAKHLDEAVAKMQAMPETLSFDQVTEAKLPNEAASLKSVFLLVAEIQKALEGIETELTDNGSDKEIHSKIHMIVLGHMEEPVLKLQKELENIEREATLQPGIESMEQKINFAILDIVTPPLFELKKGLEIISSKSDDIESGLLTIAAVESMVPPLQEIQNGLAQLGHDIESGQVNEDFNLDSADTQKLLQSIAQALLYFETNIGRLTKDSPSKVQTGLYNLKEELSSLIGDILDKGINKYHITLFENLKQPIDELNYCILQTERKSISGSLVDLIEPLGGLNEKVKLGHDILNLFNNKQNHRNLEILEHIKEIIKSIVLNIEEHDLKIRQMEIDLAEQIALEEDIPTVSMQEAFSREKHEREAIQHLEELQSCVCFLDQSDIKDMQLSLTIKELAETVCQIVNFAREIKNISSHGTSGDFDLQKKSGLLDIILEFNSPIKSLTVALNNIVETARVEGLKQGLEGSEAYAIAVESLKNRIQKLQNKGEGSSSLRNKAADQVLEFYVHLHNCLEATDESNSNGPDGLSTMDDISGIKTAAESLSNSAINVDSLAENKAQPDESAEGFDMEIIELKEGITRVLGRYAELDLGAVRNETKEKIEVAFLKMQHFDRFITENFQHISMEPLVSITKTNDEGNFADAVCSLKTCILQVQEHLPQAELQRTQDIKISELSTLALLLLELRESLEIFDNQEQLMSLSSVKPSTATFDLIETLKPLILSIQESSIFEKLQSLPDEGPFTQLKELAQPIIDLENAALSVQQQFPISQPSEQISSMNASQLKTLAKPILVLREAILHVQENVVCSSIKEFVPSLDNLKFQAEKMYELLEHYGCSSFKALDNLVELSTQEDVSDLNTFAEVRSVDDEAHLRAEAEYPFVQTYDSIRTSLAGGIKQLQDCLTSRKTSALEETPTIGLILNELKTELETLQNELIRDSIDPQTLLHNSNVAKTMFKLKECLVHTYETNWEESLEDVEKMFEDVLLAFPILEVQLSRQMFIKVRKKISSMIEFCRSIECNELDLSKFINSCEELLSSLEAISEGASVDVEKSSPLISNLKSHSVNAFRAISDIIENSPDKRKTSFMGIQSSILSILEFIDENEGSLRIIELLQEVDGLNFEHNYLPGTQKSSPNKAQLDKLMQNVILAKAFLMNIEKGLKSNDIVIGTFFEENRDAVERLQKRLERVDNEVLTENELLLTVESTDGMDAIQTELTVLQKYLESTKEKLKRKADILDASQTNELFQIQNEAELVGFETYTPETLTNIQSLIECIDCVDVANISGTSSLILTSLRNILSELQGAADSSKGSKLQDLIYLPMVKLRDLLAFARKTPSVASKDYTSLNLITERANKIFVNILNSNSALRQAFIHDITAKIITTLEPLLQDSSVKHNLNNVNIENLHVALVRLAEEISYINKENPSNPTTQTSSYQNIRQAVEEIVHSLENLSEVPCDNYFGHLDKNFKEILENIRKEDFCDVIEILQELEAQQECFLKIVDFLRRLKENCSTESVKVVEELPTEKVENELNILNELFEEIKAAEVNDELKTIVEFLSAQVGDNSLSELLLNIRENIVHTYDGKSSVSKVEQFETLITSLLKNNIDVLSEHVNIITNNISKTKEILSQLKVNGDQSKSVELFLAEIGTLEALVNIGNAKNGSGYDTKYELQTCLLQIHELLDVTKDLVAKEKKFYSQNSMQLAMDCYESLRKNEKPIEYLIASGKILSLTKEILSFAEELSKSRQDIDENPDDIEKCLRESSESIALEPKKSDKNLEVISKNLEEAECGTIDPRNENRSGTKKADSTKLASKDEGLKNKLEETVTSDMIINEVKKLQNQLLQLVEEEKGLSEVISTMAEFLQRPQDESVLLQLSSKLHHIIHTYDGKISNDNVDKQIENLISMILKINPDIANKHKVEYLSLVKENIFKINRLVISLNELLDEIKFDALTQNMKHLEDITEHLKNTNTVEKSSERIITLQSKLMELFVFSDDLLSLDLNNLEDSIEEIKVNATKLYDIIENSDTPIHVVNIFRHLSDVTYKTFTACRLLSKYALESKDLHPSSKKIYTDESSKKLFTEYLQEIVLEDTATKRIREATCVESTTANISPKVDIAENKLEDKLQKPEEEGFPQTKPTEISEVKAEEGQEIISEGTVKKQKVEETSLKSTTAGKFEEKLQRTKEEGIPNVKVAERSEIKTEDVQEFIMENTEKIKEIIIEDTVKKQKAEEIPLESTAVDILQTGHIIDKKVEDRSQKHKEEDKPHAKSFESSVLKPEKVQKIIMEDTVKKQKVEDLSRKSATAGILQKGELTEEIFEEKLQKAKEEGLSQAKTAQILKVKPEKAQDMVMEDTVEKQKVEENYQESTKADILQKGDITENELEDRSQKPKEEGTSQSKASKILEVKPEKVQEIILQDTVKKEIEELSQESATADILQKSELTEEKLFEKLQKPKEECIPQAKMAEISQVKQEEAQDIVMEDTVEKQEVEEISLQSITAGVLEKGGITENKFEEKVPKEEGIPQAKEPNISDEIVMESALKKQEVEEIYEKSTSADLLWKDYITEKKLEEKLREHQEEGLPQAKTAQISEVKPEKVEVIVMEDTIDKQKVKEISLESATADILQKSQITENKLEENLQKPKEEGLPQEKMATISQIKPEKAQEMVMEDTVRKQKVEDIYQESTKADILQKGDITEEKLKEELQKPKEEGMPQAKRAEISQVKPENAQEMVMEDTVRKQKVEDIYQESTKADILQKGDITENKLKENLQKPKEEGIPQAKMAEISQVKQEKVEEIVMEDTINKQKVEEISLKSTTADILQKGEITEEKLKEELQKPKEEGIPQAKRAEISQVKPENAQEMVMEDTAKKQRVEEIPLESTKADILQKGEITEQQLKEKLQKPKEEGIPQAKMAKISQIKPEKVEEIVMEDTINKQKVEEISLKSTTADILQKGEITEQKLKEKLQKPKEEGIPQAKMAEISQVKPEKIEEIVMEDTINKQKVEEISLKSTTADILQKGEITEEKLKEELQKPKEEGIPQAKRAEISQVKPENAQEMVMEDTAKKQRVEEIPLESTKADILQKGEITEQQLKEKLQKPKEEGIPQAKMAKISQIKPEKVEEIVMEDTVRKQKVEDIYQESTKAVILQRGDITENKLKENLQKPKEEGIPQAKMAEISQVKPEKVEEIVMEDTINKQKVEEISLKSTTADILQKGKITEEKLKEELQKPKEEGIPQAKRAEISQVKPENAQEMVMEDTVKKQEVKEIPLESTTANILQKGEITEEKFKEKMQKPKEEGTQQAKMAKISKVKSEKVQEIVMEDTVKKQKVDEIALKRTTANILQKGEITEKKLDKKLHKPKEEGLPQAKTAQISNVKPNKVEEIVMEATVKEQKVEEISLENTSTTADKLQKGVITENKLEEKLKKPKEEDLPQAKPAQILEVKPEMVEKILMEDTVINQKVEKISLESTTADMLQKGNITEKKFVGKVQQPKEEGITEAKAAEISEVKIEQVPEVILKNTLKKGKVEEISSQGTTANMLQQGDITENKLEDKLQRPEEESLLSARKGGISEIILDEQEIKLSVEGVTMKGLEPRQVPKEAVEKAHKGRKETRTTKRIPNFELKLTNRNAPIGSNIKLTCSVSDSNVNINWFKDNTLILNDSNYQLTFCDGLAFLEINAVDSKDCGVFRCVASNISGEVETSCLVNVYEVPVSKLGTPPIFTRNVRGKLFKLYITSHIPQSTK